MKNSMKFFAMAVISLTILLSYKADSHCDTKSGPVISAAREALKTGNVNLVLVWVQQDDEEQIKKAFQKTLEMRRANPKNQDFADNYFFETLVRIHRQGEGAPYTGIKDEAELEPPIQAADEALASGSIDKTMNLLNESVKHGVHEKFEQMMAVKSYDKNNVAAGREFVDKYVVFMHYVEGIYNTAKLAHSEHHVGGESVHAHAQKETVHKEVKVEHAETHSTDHTTHILIIAGTVLIIIVQLLLSRKKS